MAEKLSINFVLPPSVHITGGLLAILEYANRFTQRGHDVSVTTYPNSMWPGDNPFPWFDLKAELHYVRDRPRDADGTAIPWSGDATALGRALGARLGARAIAEAMVNVAPPAGHSATVQHWGFGEWLTGLRLMEAMPECDLNIATLWTTAVPVYLSRKGKPVYFMQHFEEVFYGMQAETMVAKLGARLSYGLPMYKVANSSWLAGLMRERFGQSVPWSNNAIELADFSPRPKTSEQDGIVRVVTYSRPDQWKGFPDAVAAMQRVMDEAGERVEWHVFGYAHPELPPENGYAPYVYHPKLSFTELAALYAACDIALCPSWYESFPLPPLEAMACRTVPVTTREGTEEYAFDGVNALVVGARDVGAMADAVLRLVNDPELRARLAGEGRRTAEGFGWERAVAERERILLAIHRGDPGYDVTRSAQLDLRDADGIAFEAAPAGCGQGEAGLYWEGGALFLLHDGVRRHVLRPALIPELIRRGAAYLDVDPLVAARIPLGNSLTTIHDVPGSLARAPAEQSPARLETSLVE